MNPLTKLYLLYWVVVGVAFLLQSNARGLERAIAQQVCIAILLLITGGLGYATRERLNTFSIWDLLSIALLIALHSGVAFVAIFSKEIEYGRKNKK